MNLDFYIRCTQSLKPRRTMTPMKTCFTRKSLSDQTVSTGRRHSSRKPQPSHKLNEPSVWTDFKQWPTDVSAAPVGRENRPEKYMSQEKLALLIKLCLNRKTSTRNSWPPSGTTNFSMYGLAGDQGNNGADMQPGGKSKHHKWFASWKL